MKKTLINNKEEYKNSLLNFHLDDKLQELHDKAIENDIPIMQDEGLTFLLTLINIKKPKRILEIGSAVGYSSIVMVKNSDAIIDTMEIDDIRYNEAVNNINSFDLDKRINIYHCDALESFELVKDNKYDLLFIDAAKGQYVNFFNIYSPLLNKEGIVVTDNLYFHDLLFTDIESRNLRGLVKRVKKYDDFLLENQEYETHVFNIGDGIGVSVKK